MTFDQLMAKTLEVFPDAVLSQDDWGNIIIEPGYTERIGETELMEYEPES